LHCPHAESVQPVVHVDRLWLHDLKAALGKSRGGNRKNREKTANRFTLCENPLLRLVDILNPAFLF
jgi:hypothetical protein